MARQRMMRLLIATLALIGARPALAATITLTGVVENDFPKVDPSVHVLSVSDNPLNIGQSDFITQNGWVSGWSIKDVRTSYDSATDTLSVGFNTFKNSQGAISIVGDSDGNGDPGGASPGMVKAGGIDTAHLGGRKSVAVAFAADDPKNPGSHLSPTIIAGVPADKATAGQGLDGFTVSTYRNVDLGLGYNFGKSLGVGAGSLAFDPSTQHPGLEFTIKNFSKLSGLDPIKGVWVTAFAGSPDDVVAGETSLGFTRLPSLSEQNIPEPATLLAWSVLAGAAVLHRRRRSAG